MRFISVIKPGIIFGNLITVSGGYFLGTQGHIHFWLLLATLLGMSLVIAAGCVFNNYIDRDIDKLMERTANRVLVKGAISGKVALLYAVLLGVSGFWVLYSQTNLLAVVIAFLGLLVYVVAYSLCLKRTTYGTEIGAIAGAVPPVVGYCAVTNNFNTGAWILFAILFLWQIPHFYAIAIYRLKDFAAASIPVLPIKKTIRYTKVVMLLYIAAFTIAAVMPTVFGYTGLSYFIVALGAGLIWFILGIQGLKTNNDKLWSRKMFIFSIINITLLSAMMAVK